MKHFSFTPYLVKKGGEVQKFEFGKEMSCKDAKEIYFVSDNNGFDLGLVAQDENNYTIRKWTMDNPYDYFPQFDVIWLTVSHKEPRQMDNFFDTQTKERGVGNLYVYPDGLIEIGYGKPNPQVLDKFGWSISHRQGAMRDPRANFEK